MSIEAPAVRYQFGASILPVKVAPPDTPYASYPEAYLALFLEKEAVAVRRRHSRIKAGQDRAVSDEHASANRRKTTETMDAMLAAFRSGCETLPQIMMTLTIPDASARLALRQLATAGLIVAIGKTKTGAMRWEVVK